jgi:hypothetical protein
MVVDVCHASTGEAEARHQPGLHSETLSQIKDDNTKCGEDIQQLKPSYTIGGNVSP